jgi:hypothetical protein
MKRQRGHAYFESRTSAHRLSVAVRGGEKDVFGVARSTICRALHRNPPMAAAPAAM